MTRKTEAKPVTQISSLDGARGKTSETQSEEDNENQNKSSETAAKLKKTAEKSTQQYLDAQRTQEEKLTSASVKSSSSNVEGIDIYPFSVTKCLLTKIAAKAVLFERFLNHTTSEQIFSTFFASANQSSNYFCISSILQIIPLNVSHLSNFYAVQNLY